MTQYPPRSSNEDPRDRLFRHNDHPRMTEAVRYLVRNSKIYFRRTSVSQLKVGLVNFWPTTGRIHCDDEPVSRQEKGLAAFARLLGLPEPGSAEDGTRARDRAIAQKAWARRQDRDAETTYPFL